MIRPGAHGAASDPLDAEFEEFAPTRGTAHAATQPQKHLAAYSSGEAPHSHDSSAEDSLPDGHALQARLAGKGQRPVTPTAAIHKGRDQRSSRSSRSSHASRTSALSADSPAPRSGSARPPSASRPGRGHQAAQPSSGRRDKPDPNVGRVVGSYRILSLIGSGGMGRVYRAEHVKLGRQVALKLLRADYAAKRDAIRRFFQEARAVNTIGHENIVDITDFVELPSGETFFIMELLAGCDLAELIRSQRGALGLQQGIRIATQVCDGLEAAHAAGIIHRDLKPDNIFVTEHPGKGQFVKLLDFGVAKLARKVGGEQSWQTAVGAVIGTPAYMSPEQAAGIPVDHRSDIYSLGTILYEVFSGQPVFRAKSFGQYVVKHMNERPTPPSQLPGSPQLPSALEELILCCLEKEPSARYQSVAELRTALLTASASADTAVDRSAPALQVKKRARTENARHKAGRKRRSLLLAIGAGALIASAIAAYATIVRLDGGELTRGSESTPSTTDPPPNSELLPRPTPHAAQPLPTVTPLRADPPPIGGLNEAPAIPAPKKRASKRRRRAARTRPRRHARKPRRRPRKAKVIRAPSKATATKAKARVKPKPKPSPAISPNKLVDPFQ